MTDDSSNRRFFMEEVTRKPSASFMVFAGAALASVALTALWLDPAYTLLVAAPILVGLLAAKKLEANAPQQTSISNSELPYLDDLTRLPNRRRFLEELHVVLQRPLDVGEYTAVYFIDLDKFKGINDALGHLAGDRFLQEISRRLQRCVPDGAILARFGGDEFTLMLNVKDRQEVIDLAQKMMDSFDEDVEILGNKIWANTSIGIAMVGKPRPSAHDLLSMADAALYNAKAQGRGQYVLFEPNLPRPTPQSLSLDADIRRALERQQLVLHYQPVVRLRDLRIVGFEALIRWQHPSHGLLSPAEFIPVAEESGLIKSLGAWCIEAACERISSWRGLYSDELTMSVNLSALQFRQKDMLEHIAAAASRAGLVPGALRLEITESVLLRDDLHTVEVLARLRNLGFEIAVDDFGIGYSSLSYLKSFRVDALKLDQSFLTDVDDERTRALVRGVTQLGHSLGVAVVAEGIETREQLDLVVQAGCDEGQGFFLGRPIDEKQVIELLLTGPDLAHQTTVTTPAPSRLAS